MENHFITILKAPVSQYSKEFLSVGLFASDGCEAFFEVSDHKLRILKKLISEDSFHLVEAKMKMIQKDFDISIKAQEQ